ncbi:LacI family DNA-binding transcriptional regulator [Salinibacterium sp. M195]|uniref:LacI family DNA-binding transcriptional regulator n=1 Tax=Salinibacterium sp. M195 TaxID=2583374 RepID=UPI001C634843|nr:LacI family DNA-binding transcriptional regulator [Salinibacterium sp. M195]QYH36690.1 LacI family transcriptional regulator [Salinibacterium sp. M195]
MTQETDAPAVVPPTLLAVAQLAKVSRSTASRVLNGSPQVTEEAIAAVTRAISELNYVPNRTARNLANRTTQSIAMVIPQQTSKFFADPYFAAVIQGAALHMASTEYTLTLLIESDDDPQKTRRFLEGGNVDGALILSHYTRDADYVALSRNLPVVFGVQPLSTDEGPYSVVDVNNVEAAVLATQLLIGHGCTQIAIIGAPLGMSAGRDRAEGWRSTLASAGLAEGPFEEGDLTPAGGAAAMERLLDVGRPIDGLVAATAQMAQGAMGVLKDRGIAVPEDIAVATIDNNFFSTSTHPPLTSVDLNTDLKGAVMAETLLRIVRGEIVEKFTTIPIELIERESTRARS